VRLLVTYRGLPWTYAEGYHLRVLHLFRRLAARGHQVHLLALVHDDEQERRLPETEAHGVFSSIRLLRMPRRNPLGRLRTNLGLAPVASFRSEYPGFPERVAAEVERLRTDLGLDAGYVFDPWADLLYGEVSGLPTLLDVCDCRSFFYERRLERGDLPLAQRLRTRQLLHRFRAFETWMLRHYPVATVVSEADREALLHLVPEARVEVIQNGVDLEMFRPSPEVTEEPGRLLLFGNMDFLPNVDAAVHFAREILPRVRARVPEARFTVVGTNPLPEVRALADEVEGVEVTGGVPDLVPWIQRSTMLVAPMRFGAGIKNKVLETLAMEKPVVTNATGAEALRPEVRELLRLARDDDEFADHVVALLQDEEERRRLGRLGRERMQRFHSWDAAADRYEELLSELATGAVGSRVVTG